MNTHNRHFRFKLAGGLTLVVSCLLFAAAVFIPSTQPTVVVGQYALQNRDLLNSGTIAYRPWFENGAWQGDIIEYAIDQYGGRSTDVSVGANPPTQGSTGGCNRALSGCWSARASFLDNGGDDPTGSYWQSRNIFTHIDTVANPSATNMLIDFTWDLLSDTQRELLDQDTYDTIVAAVAADPTLNIASLNTATASDILNYVRGQRLHEKQNATEAGSLGDLRRRYSLLGDITGTPVYIGTPQELLRSVTGFNTFATNNASRAGRIAVGANDGMLHVFDEDDGSEVYAYIPSMVLDKLGALAARDATYNHTYYVDGELTVNSAQIGASIPVWHTILTGGGGAGFEGLFALDVTDPAYTTDKLLFEKTGGNWGQIYGAPSIGFIGSSNADPTWYIFTGNGYKATTGQPTSLMMVNLDTFAVTEISTGATGGLSAAVLLSTDDDDQVEMAFAGDINGDLWMFEIDQSNPANSIATMIYDGDPDQPISNAPAVAKHPTEDGYIVYFGTGSIFSLDDALNDGLVSGGDPADQNDYTGKQAIHGLWLNTSDLTTLKASGNLPYTSSDLQSQTLSEVSKIFVGTTEEHVRIVPSANTVYYRCPFGIVTCPTLHQGWKVDFPNCGERLVGSPFVRAGRVQFVTTNPTGPTPNCGTNNSDGDSWVMSLDYVQGTDNSKIVYNLNNDQLLDNGDAVQVSGVDKAPVGLNLGPGNISQPTFARLRAGVDKMFINGIQLPIREFPTSADIPGGHIDVVTDSPNNQTYTTTNGVISPNNRSKHSEGYNITSNDGLGAAVDGHVHDYDGMHDVDYVDLFELEPRRGQANLITSLADPPVSGVCSTADGEKGILVGTSCLQAIEGELNRAYDTLHTDADGASDPLNGPVDGNGLPTPIKQSEVNSLNATTPPDFTTAVPAQKFVVVLANADLSTGGVLQIGCRTWPVVGYQTMITTQLNAGTAPNQLDDTVNGGSDNLAFTLAGIMSEDPADCPGGANSSITANEALAKGLGSTPTIRVGFGQRAIYDDGIVPTRSQCVLGLHKPEDKVCFTDQQILTEAEGNLATDIFYKPDSNSCNAYTGMATPPADYIRDPAWNLHITPDGNNTYRWRNGALTLQLLKVNNDGSAAYTLQTQYLKSGSGIIAQAFTPVQDDNGLNGANKVTITRFVNNEGANESGLLYEADIFFHYSALVDEVRNSDPAGNNTPPEGTCYGGSGYNGQANIDIGGLTLGEYQALTNPLVAECAANPAVTCDLDRYFQLLELIDSATSETALNQALLELAELIDGNDLLEAYHDMRDYVGDKIPEQHKLDGDKAQGGDDGSTSSSSDGVPAQVTTIETIDLEARGPNFIYGRRNWIDIKQ